MRFLWPASQRFPLTRLAFHPHPTMRDALSLPEDGGGWNTFFVLKEVNQWSSVTS